MCGRITLTRDMLSIIEELAIEEWEDPDRYFPSYNIAPTQLSPVMVQPGKRVVKLMRWGLIPFWAKDESIGSKMINARSETLLEKPSYKNLVPRKRCVVITDGYYEWKKEGGRKIPYYIHHREGKLIPLAGLWDKWRSPEGKTIFSYTVVTTEPMDSIAHIHNRMPVILSHEHLDIWTNTTVHPHKDALQLLKPYPGTLEAYPVSTFVNSPRNNSPVCIEPVH